MAKTQQIKRTIYQDMLDETLRELTEKGERPSLLLHACCAPCSSYVVEYLSNYFDITLLYYNPNIQPEEEYVTRARELERLADVIEIEHHPKVVILPYTPQDFDALTQGLEDENEGGERCKKCYRLRLEQTAKKAKELSFDYFTTTLSLSRHKKASVLCEIGRELSEIYGVKYLYSDFKKKNGNIRSCELAEKYNLYRQKYCGCLLSSRRK